MENTTETVYNPKRLEKLIQIEILRKQARTYIMLSNVCKSKCYAKEAMDCLLMMGDLLSEAKFRLKTIGELYDQTDQIIKILDHE